MSVAHATVHAIMGRAADARAHRVTRPNLKPSTCCSDCVIAWGIGCIKHCKRVVDPRNGLPADFQLLSSDKSPWRRLVLCTTLHILLCIH